MNHETKVTDLPVHEKRELLERLLRDNLDRPTHPLSHGQTAIWLAHQLAPETAAYNIAYVGRLGSGTSLARLESAFRTVAERHAPLRTTFESRNGRPVQRVEPSVPQGFFEVTNASGWTAARLEREWQGETDRPFDLTRGPIFRVRVFADSPSGHLVTLVIHHLVADFWSIEVLLHELRCVYSYSRNGARAPLPALAVEYSDYVRSEHDAFGASDTERLFHYWQGQLAGAPTCLSLPTDFPRPCLSQMRGREHRFELDAATVEAFSRLARQHATTPYVVFLSAFEVAIRMFSGQDDFVVVSPTNVRARAELEPLIGYFVNPVALRADLQGDPRFTELLSRTRSTVHGALAHQELPLSRIIDRLGLRSGTARPPYFEAEFAWHRPPLTRAPADREGLDLEPVFLGQRGALSELRVHLLAAANGAHGVVQYDADLFHEGSIIRFAEWLRVLVDRIAMDPNTRLSDLCAASGPRAHVGKTPRSRPDADGALEVVAEFEAQVNRTPEALAVTTVGESLTYDALNHRANQLAHFLQKRGAGPDEVIAICLNRSSELIVAILATLKAGAAFLSLDPALPAGRLSVAVTDSRPRLVITERALSDRIPAGVSLWCVDDDQAALSDQPSHNPAVTIRPDALAYVIYPAGVKPAGVTVSHEALATYLSWSRRTYCSPASNGTLVHSSADLDATVILTALLAGQSVHIASGPDHGAALAAGVRSGGPFGFLKLTPAEIRVLNRWLSPEELAGKAATLVVRGEAVDTDLLAGWGAHSPTCRVFTEYSPTEAHIGCCVYEVPAGLAASSTPIGHPLARTRVYVLNERRKPVPAGAVGELYLGGATIPRGYLHRHGLTDDRFMTDPFVATEGAAMYRTGDLVRYRHDGELEHLRRADRRVKINGRLINLAEVELALTTHPTVNEAVVEAREVEPGQRSLVAFVVGTGDLEPDGVELAEFLSDSLPDWMIPARESYVPLAALPLTADGTVDRGALPTPSLTASPSGQRAVPPRGAMEAELADIWGEVLGVGGIGVHDSFFDLGGGSLECVDVAERASRAGLPCSPETIFRWPTIAELAVALSGSEPPDQGGNNV